jgi:RuvB-like protein 1 (pontin 52)
MFYFFESIFGIVTQPHCYFCHQPWFTTIRGTETQSPHGIPVDLLDRMRIIPTTPYAVNEMVHILFSNAGRHVMEGMELEDDPLKELRLVGARTSLRHAVQVLTAAKLIAETQGGTKITPDDVQQVDMLFLDGKATSAQMLATTEGIMS